jgi:hypothetical protein
MEDTEAFVELKPVVKSKDLYRVVRNIISNELKLDKTEFEKLVAARVENYLVGNGVADVIKTQVGKRLAGHWGDKNDMEKFVAQQVVKSVNELIGAEVRRIVADKLKDGLAGLA